MNKKAIVIIVAVVLICAGAFGGWMYHSAQIDKMRNAGVKELHGIVTLDDYREAQQKEINEVLSASEAKINESKDQKAVDEVISDAKKAVAEIKTASQLDIEEGLASLEKSVDLNDYRKAQKKEVTKILDDAKASIEKADDTETIQAVIKDANKKIAKIKTDKQLTAEEEKAKKEAEARAAAEAAAAAKRNKTISKKSNNSGGCVGDDAENFY